MPPVGFLVGGMDFSDLFLKLISATADHSAVVVKYGFFINMVIDFLIVAFAIFLIIKGMNRLTKKPEPVPVPPTTKECPECLMTIPINAKRCGY